jgi:hypothetical protein
VLVNRREERGEEREVMNEMREERGERGEMRVMMTYQFKATHDQQNINSDRRKISLIPLSQPSIWQHLL